MTKYPYDQRHSSPAVQRARDKLASTSPLVSRVSRDIASPGGVRVDLDVTVADLAEAGLNIKETLPSAWVSEILDDGKSPRWVGNGEATLELHMEHEASFVRVTGQGNFLLSHPCVRCLNEIPFDVKLAVDLRLVEKVEGPIEGAWGEGDGDGDDFEGPTLGDASDLEDISIASYQDGVVKVRELLREQLFLELPLHPACDCRDARPDRECAFNETSANAGERVGWMTSRWSGLAALRDNLPVGPSKVPGKGIKGATRQDLEAQDEVIALPGRASAPSVVNSHDVVTKVFAMPLVAAAGKRAQSPRMAAAAKNTSAKNASAKNTSAKNTSAKKPAAKNTSAKKTSAKKKTR